MKTQYRIAYKMQSGNALNAVIILLLLITACSCDDFVEVDAPTTQLSSPLVFEEYSTANAAMVAIYAEIRNNGLVTGNPNGMLYKLGEYTDELQFFGAGGQTDASFYNNIVLANNPEVKNWWNATYNQIYATNAVLEGLENTTALTQMQKEQLQGEALFIRAMLHFHLTNLFGDVPYVTTTNYTTNTTIAKTKSSVIYEKIETDLLTAEAQLSIAYPTEGRVRPNKATVQALLARVYLYGERWADADIKSSEILNNVALYGGVQNLDKVFLKDSFTTIWQLSPANEGENTLEAATNIFLQGPPPVSGLSDTFVNGFEEGDQRKSQWIKAVTDGTTVWHHAFKYKTFENTGASVEYSILFRTAEQYLIRAEARTKQGDLLGAREDLNHIRNKAGLENTTANTPAELLTAIINERRAELFSEGHRFFDLKRTQRLNEILASTKPGWNPNDQLFPIPETELLLNPNLNPQNPGY